MAGRKRTMRSVYVGMLTGPVTKGIADNKLYEAYELGLRERILTSGRESIRNLQTS